MKPASSTSTTTVARRRSGRPRRDAQPPAFLSEVSDSLLTAPGREGPLRIMGPRRGSPALDSFARTEANSRKRRAQARSEQASLRIESEDAVFASSSRPRPAVQKRVKRQPARPFRLSFSSRRKSCDFLVFRREEAKLAFARGDLLQKLVVARNQQDDDCDTDEEQILAATRQVKRDLEEGLDFLAREAKSHRPRIQRAMSYSYAPRRG